MAARYVGAHLPTGKGLDFALREAKTLGCTALQVFTSSPRMWRANPPTPEKIASFKAAIADTKIDRLISHDTYLVNLCHADEEVALKSRRTLQEEIERCNSLSIGLVVSHIGALLARPKEEGFSIVCRHLKSLLNEMPDGVIICMETTAGQGSAINSRFEEIAEILDSCGAHPKLAVCLDSCHVFAAGYDLRTAETYQETMEKFNKTVGISNLKVIHLNDSKKPFGSRVDRHDSIGKGLIGMEAFSCFMNDPRLEEIPMVIETPTENEGHKNDLTTLFGLRKS